MGSEEIEIKTIKPSLAEIQEIWGSECLHIKEVDGIYYGIMRMMFTVGIAVGLGYYSYGGRFCFNTLQDALAFYNDWDFKTRPTVGVDGCTADKVHPFFDDYFVAEKGPEN